MIIVLDCGSQYNQNIARRVRENRVFTEIRPYTTPVGELRRPDLEGIIISGGPWSVYDEGSPLYPKKVFDIGVPVLGICYGMQSMAYLLGGKDAVEPAEGRREYGPMEVIITSGTDSIFKGIAKGSIQTWMSHGDVVKGMPDGFKVAATSGTGHLSAMIDPHRRLYAVQFHPEVDNTEHGRDILANFVDICGCARDWTSGNFIEEKIREVRERVGDAHAIGGISGGVDSTTASTLMHKALGSRYHPILVDNGVLRKGEAREVLGYLGRHFPKMDVAYVDAGELFLARLAGVTDPEEKRKIIGGTFIEVFEREARRIGMEVPIRYLMQGTLYPDVIESVPAYGGPQDTIKSHHNVGGLPERMDLELIEPFRELFKDEVREVAKELGIPKEIYGRHPFPGPGLAIRIIGEVTPEKVAILQEADRRFITAIREHGHYDRIWQALTVLTDSKSVGVMGDARTHEYAAVLRAVTSRDGMTADVYEFPPRFLRDVTVDIVNSVRGINRVTYDCTPKPPGTIEWE
ncbi:glutamine-hydrolyzing GMP synthase [Candidatus Woesearchaeota archaeon]|nr:glutamine-hydrolyzing GMP synthase [Candidatus Woesearchaeota archaeon]